MDESNFNGERRVPAAFDRYVSLGGNCEAAFNFRRLLGRDVGSYFNWLVTPVDALLKILKADFSQDFQRENLYYKGDQIKMVTDRRYNISHHSPFVDIDGKLDGPEFETRYARHVEKLEFLKRRFRDGARGDERILYFVKSGETGLRAKARALRQQLLESHQNDNFEILVLQEAHRFEPPWEEEGVLNRYLQSFSPFNDVPNTHVPSWDKVFAEFPLSDRLQSLPNRSRV